MKKKLTLEQEALLNKFKNAEQNGTNSCDAEVFELFCKQLRIKKWINGES